MKYKKPWKSFFSKIGKKRKKNAAWQRATVLGWLVDGSFHSRITKLFGQGLVLELLVVKLENLKVE